MRVIQNSSSMVKARSDASRWLAGCALLMALASPASAMPLRSVGYSSGSDEIALASGGGVRTLASSAGHTAWPQHTVASVPTASNANARSSVAEPAPTKSDTSTITEARSEPRQERSAPAPLALLAACVSMIAFFGLRNNRSGSN